MLKKAGVDRFDALAMLLDDMAETMKAENGAGLAAVRLVFETVFVAETDNGVIDMVTHFDIPREATERAKAAFRPGRMQHYLAGRCQG